MFTHVLRPRNAMWLPAALLAAYALYAALGFSLTSGSHAATSSSTTTVTASVLPEVHLDLVNGSCGTITDPDGAGPLVEDGAFTPAAMATTDEDVTLATCAITFGSNNNGTNGATLWVESNRTVAGNSFCSAAQPAVCAAPEFTDVATTGILNAAWLTADDGTPTAGAFGLRPTAIAGCGGAGADWLTTTYYGLPQNTTGALGTQICDTNTTTDGSVTMTFRANPGASQSAVAYNLRAIFTAQAV